MQTGDYGRFLGRLDLEVDAATGRIVAHRGELIPVGEEIAPDPEVERAYAAEQERVRQMTRRVIGELRDAIDFSEERECAAGNLLADVLLDRVKGAEIALVLAGHWRAGLDAGPLTVGALIEAIRSSANPARVELTGAQIAQCLRAALKPENIARKLRPLRGVACGMPHVAGMTVRYDPQSLELLDVRVRGEPLQAKRKYVVAATDLEFYDFTGYRVISQEQIEYEVPIIVPEVLEEYIAARASIRAPVMGRVVADSR